MGVLLGTLLWAGAVPAIAVQAAPPPLADLTLTQGTQKIVLDNGLTVLTKEIHTAPVVSVQIWYRVGTRNEPAGQNGISHQLEHLMFKGTRDRPIQFGRFFSALGSQSNAFTSYDMTAYFGTVEQDKLEAMLVLEADRMENALIGAAELDSEKRVVISELQGYENRPSYRLDRAVMKAAFPHHPYGLPVGGTKADVEQFTLEQVQEYYKSYYTPDNATLVITGNFSTEPVLQTVREIFGRIPKRTGQVLPPFSGPEPDRQNSTPVVLREPGSAALLEVVYPLPNIQHPDIPAIALMDMVLTGGRSSRLYQALVESGLASDVGAYPAEMIEPGWYELSATAAPGQDIRGVEQTLQETLVTLQQTGVTQEELDRARTQLKTYFVRSSQDIGSQAEQLGYYQTVTGDYQFGDRYLAALDRVTVDDIQRVAQTYLDPALRTVGFFEPTLADGQPGLSSTSSSRMVENFNPGEPIDPAEVARYLPPLNPSNPAATQPIPEEFTLDNGLRILLLSDPNTPMVNLNGWIEAGMVYDTNLRAGLATLTANNLMNGTQTQDALALAKTLEDVGARLSFTAWREGVNIGGDTLPEHLPTLIHTLSDVLRLAAFPSDQVELSRQRALNELRQELDDPQELGWRMFRQTIYPSDHPFHSFPTEGSLNRISRTDLLRFYKTHYRPDTTVLSLVGNFDLDQVKTLLTEQLGSWEGMGRRPTLQVPPVPLPQRTTYLNPMIPGKTEAMTYIGYSSIARQDERFYAALVLNEILGGSTLSSRLGTEIRDRQGLTYGIYSFFQAGQYPGPFAIAMQTAPEDADQAIQSTLALLQQIRAEGVTEAELESAKRSITSSYPVELADPSNLSEEILNNAVLGLSLEEIRQFPDRIQAVPLEQVQQAIQDLIHPDQVIIVTAGPGDQP